MVSLYMRKTHTRYTSGLYRCMCGVFRVVIIRYSYLLIDLWVYACVLCLFKYCIYIGLLCMKRSCFFVSLIERLRVLCKEDEKLCTIHIAQRHLYSQYTHMNLSIRSVQPDVYKNFVFSIYDSLFSFFLFFFCF